MKRTTLTSTRLLIIKMFLLLIITISTNKTFSQCAAATEFSCNFGTTANPGAWPTGIISHDLWSGNPSGSNSAAILRTSNGPSNNYSTRWQNRSDRTSPGTGAFLVSNSSWNDFSGTNKSHNIFYLNRAVCPNTNYTLSFWGFNIANNTMTSLCGTPERCDLQMRTYTSTNVLISSSPVQNFAINGNWAQMTWTFNSGANANIFIVIDNTTGNSSGSGCGSDFALDDVLLTRCAITNAALGTTASQVNATCENNNGTGTAIPTGGGGIYTYSWNSTPVQTGITATALATGSYTVTVNAAPACSLTPVTANITISNVGTKPVITAPISNTYCPNKAVPTTNLSSTPSGATYSWTNNNTAIGLTASGTGQIPVYTSTNSSGSTIIGSITITPTLAGCTGNSVSYSNSVYTSSNASCLTTLEIELITFTIEDKNRIEIKWTTASEFNNDYFTIEKSEDGINWISWKKINSNGTNNSESNYIEIDSEPFIGLSYYKLTAVNGSGIITNSEIRSLNHKLKDDELWIQNVSAEKINIISNNPKTICKIITNDGKIIYNDEIENINSLMINSGHYILIYEYDGILKTINFLH